jgi:hypothetical protein
MSLHEEMIAADGLQYEVRNYRKKNQYSWNWSCNVCGDSATNLRKARFWVDAKQQSLVCHCFNCGYSAPFTMYLRDYHAHAHESFRRSTIKESAPTTFDLDRIFNRKGVYDDTLCHLFYVDKYPDRKQWLDTLVQKKIKLKKYNINRLIQLHGEKHVKE